MPLISHKVFADLLSQRKGASFVTITTKTIPRMLKKDRDTGEPNKYFGKLIKIARRNGMVGVSYENAVNNQLKREGKEPDFEAFPLPWGEHLNAYFVTYHGKLYLKYKPKKNLEEIYRNLESGLVVPAEAVEPLLIRSGSSRQGTENRVGWLTPCLDDIRSVRIDGQTYIFS